MASSGRGSCSRTSRSTKRLANSSYPGSGTTASNSLPAQEPDYRALAEHVLASAAPSDPDTLFRLQLVAGRYAEALQSLRAMPPNVANVRWEIYAKAKALEAGGQPFDAAFAQAFRGASRGEQTAAAINNR